MTDSPTPDVVDAPPPVVDAPVVDKPVADAPAPEFDWRKAIAGDDEKELKRLQRFADLKAYDKSAQDSQKALRDSGRIKLPGKDATDEDRASYYKAIGVPEKADAYKITLPQGYEPDEEAKASLETIKGFLHKRGGHAASPETVQAAHDLYIELLTDAGAKASARAVEAKETTESKLRGEWRHDFDHNMQLAEHAVAFYGPKGLDASEVMNMPMADGSTLGSQEWFVRFLANVGTHSAEDPYFAATGNLKGDPSSLESERDELMKLRHSNNPKDREKYAQVSGPGGRLGTINKLLAAGSKNRAA